MAWTRGYIRLDCGHDIGTDLWDKLWVYAEVRCPQCKSKREVVKMSRVSDARPSRDFQLGVAGGDGRAEEAGDA